MVPIGQDYLLLTKELPLDQLCVEQDLAANVGTTLLVLWELSSLCVFIVVVPLDPSCSSFLLQLLLCNNLYMYVREHVSHQ